MFFQISPVRPGIKCKPVQKKDDSEQPEVLSLAPFTPNPKLFFENVQVGDTATRKLLIENPNNYDVRLFVTNHMPQELNVTFNVEQITIEKKSNGVLELIWHPSNEEFCRHTFTIGDGKRIRRDIPVAFKSLFPKKSKTGTKTNKAQMKLTKQKSPVKKSKMSANKPSPTKRYYGTKPPYISPKRYSPSQKKHSPKMKSPIKGSSINIQKTSLNGPRPRNATYKIRDKENILLMDTSHDSNVFVSPSSATFRLDYLQPIERRETYVVNSKKNTSLNELIFDDSLENISPNVSFETKAENIGIPDSKRQPLSISNRDNEYSNIYKYIEEKVVSTSQRENFEYKIMQMNSFSFSPISTPVRHNQNFSPGLSSTIEKSYVVRKNEEENNGKIFPTANRTFEFPPKSPNISTETYIKSNISTETYVKDNVSFETYVKNNLSGGTYTKDASVGDVANLSFSPIPSKGTISPKIAKMNVDNTRSIIQAESEGGSNARNVIEANLWSGFRSEQLSSIQEESCINLSVQEPDRSFLKRKSDLEFSFRPPKRANLTCSVKGWSKISGSPIRIAKKTTGLNIKKFLNNNKVDCVEITKQDTNRVIIQNPYLLAATNLADPFMTPHLNINEEWLDQQQVDFKKWLNALLTPPEELSLEEQVVDVAKVWQECKKREVDEAPTKESISSKYLVSHKLNYLRKSAQNLLRSKEISMVLSKAVLAVETGKLQIREDKDIHLNISLKSEIMSMMLSYNPLWLRIGLETIYNEIIPLKSNADIVGLSTFIANRLLKDPYLLKKHKTVHSPKYIAEFKKFFLKKFIVLVYFLDQAKNRKLIPHDPCLFCKKSPIKESKEMLVRLTREMLAAIGDITKCLKYMGYVVTHVQTYIHEFDYAVKNLGVDLRDGVRLTKVMEIILMQDDLTSNLRVPAISRLQKIHNMKIVFSSLERAGYEILYDISPKDIVDGHKEKTLSFLWQIVYKFEAPLMVKSATTIQTWFRSLPVVLKRRRLERLRLHREAAAAKIQGWYKRRKLLTRLENYIVILKKYLTYNRQQNAAIKIQSYYRMYRCRKLYQNQRSTIVNIQRYARGWLIRNIRTNQIKKAVIIQSTIRMYLARKKYLRLKNAANIIQARYRAKREMEAVRTCYIKQKSAAITIQRWFIAIILTRQKRNYYRELKANTIYIQSKFRANKLCRIERERYLQLRSATIRIQTWYRSVTSMKVCRQRFLMLKKSVHIIEERYEALRIMRVERLQYENLKRACISIQQRYKAQREMKLKREAYIQLKSAAITIQNRFRANKIAKKEKQHYENLKATAIFLQRKFRASKAMKIQHRSYIDLREAAVKIQVWFRASIEMRKCRTYYISLKHAVRIFEERYEAKKLMDRDSAYYKQLKFSAIVIQGRYRALIAMRKTRAEYLMLKGATVFIQDRFRANRLARLQRMEYAKLKQAALIIQSRYRAKLRMKQCRNEYLRLQSVALLVQRKYRANCLMKTARNHYVNLLKYTLVIQQHFRAKKAMEEQRNSYRSLKRFVVAIQQKWRAKKLGESQRQRFVELRRTALFIQNSWRANKLCHKERTKYNKLRECVRIVQLRWRAKKIGEKERSYYIQLKSATIILQQRWRAKCLMEKCQKEYLEMKSATIFLQRRWRAIKLTERQRNGFIILRKTVTSIQSRWRANRLAQKDRQSYLLLKNSTVTIQQRWRAQKIGQQQRKQYVALQNAALFTQRLWRANRLALQERLKYDKLKTAAIAIQRRWRNKQLAMRDRNNYLQLKNAAMVLQHTWRAKIAGRHCRRQYIALKETVIFVQRKWRANRLAKEEKAKYDRFRHHVVQIQRFWRAKTLARIEKEKYVQLRSAVIFVQNRWRAQKVGKQQKTQYELLRKMTIVVQRRWRGNKLARVEREKYTALKSASNFIQRRWRAKKQGQMDRRNYIMLKKSTTILQQRWRANKMCEQLKGKYQLMRKTAVMVQKRWRLKKIGEQVRNDYIALQRATIIIQRRWRAQMIMKISVQNYKLLKYSTIIVQRRFRANKSMECQRSLYEKTRSSAIAIQRFYRGYKNMQQLRTEFCIKREAVINIQRLFRGYLVRRTYAYYFTAEERQKRKMEKMKIAAAVKIQAAWRGHRSRSLDTPEMTNIRQRVEKANLQAEPQNTLEFRCGMALQTLMDDKPTVSGVSKALGDLDCITRHSRDKCLSLAQFFPEQLYLMIKTTNRSLPEMWACTFSVNILINMCKYPPSRPYSFLPEYIDNIVTIMMHWCDKEAKLFPTMCTLLWLFAQTPKWREIIKSLPNIEQRFLKIHSQLLRKKTMVQRAGIKGQTFFASYKSLPLPSQKPDWGLEYKHNPYVFTNSVHAFSSLLKILNM